MPATLFFLSFWRDFLNLQKPQSESGGIQKSYCTGNKMVTITLCSFWIPSNGKVKDIKLHLDLKTSSESNKSMRIMKSSKLELGYAIFTRIRRITGERIFQLNIFNNKKNLWSNISRAAKFPDIANVCSAMSCICYKSPLRKENCFVMYRSL